MALVDSYLADRHVEAPEQGLGCALAAAGSDVLWRQNDDVRRAVSRRIKDLIGLVERQFPDWGERRAREGPGDRREHGRRAAARAGGERSAAFQTHSQGRARAHPQRGRLIVFGR